MLGLFKKKQQEQELPPLPEELPGDLGASEEIQQQQPTPEPQNVHDMIPNDFTPENIAQGNQNQGDDPSQSLPEEQLYAPQNLPNPEEQEQTKEGVAYSELPAMPNPEEQLPEVNAQELPEVPDIQQGLDEPEKPEPVVDEEVPEPPSIFADEGLYKTPEEIRHLVRDSRDKSAYVAENGAGDDAEEYGEKKAYAYEQSSEASGTEGRFSPQRPEGPLFVDVDAFQHMIEYIDIVKKQVKQSDITLQHLDEIKNAKDRELDGWRTQLEDIQRKLNYVDKILFNEA